MAILKSKLLKILLGALVVLVILIGIALVLPAPQWVHRLATEKVQAGLSAIPQLKIKEIYWGHTLFSLLFKRPGTLRIKGQWEKINWSTEGLFKIVSKNPLMVEYSPNIWVESEDLKLALNGGLQLKLGVQGQQIETLEVNAESENLNLKWEDTSFLLNGLKVSSQKMFNSVDAEVTIDEGRHFGHEHSKIYLTLSKSREHVDSRIRVSDVLFEKEGLSYSLSQLEAQGSVTIGESLSGVITLRSGDGELALGDDFYTLPLEDLKIKTELELKEKALNLNANLLLRDKSIFNIHSALPKFFARIEKSEPLKAQIKSRINIYSLGRLNALLKKALEAKWPDLEKLSGSLWGELDSQLVWVNKGIQVKAFKMKTQLKDVSFQWLQQDLKVKGLGWKSEFESFKETQAKVFVGEIFYKHGKSKPLSLEFLNTLETRDDFIQLQSHLKKDVDFQWGDLQVLMDSWGFHWSLSKESIFNWGSKVALQLKPLQMASVFNQFCVETKVTLPLVLESEKLSIVADSKQILIDGKVTGKAFGGNMRLNKMKLFRYLSQRPESQFSLAWDDIRLDKFSKWGKLGKMDGYLFGYFENAVFQGAIPTQFNSKIEISPRKSREVIFSGKAMHNFVQLVGGKSVDEQMPSSMKFLLFSWPTDLIGGYNVDYAGVSLYALDGTILLETLDPKKLIQITEPRHYILKGRRFNIELKSKEYPVLVDAFQITTYIQGLMTYLSSLQSEEDSSYNDPKKVQPKELSNEIKKCRLF